MFSHKKPAWFLCLLIVLGGLLSAKAPVRILLSWEPNPEPDIAGYRIHYGTNSRVYETALNVGNVNCTVVTNLKECTLYFFAATAYNTSALESDLSEEVSLYTDNCLEVVLTTSTNLNGPWVTLFKTNMPATGVPVAFYRTSIFKDASTNVARGMTCTNGELIIQTNLPVWTGMPPSPMRVFRLDPFNWPPNQ
jgi:hypothetical protein